MWLSSEGWLELWLIPFIQESIEDGLEDVTIFNDEAECVTSELPLDEEITEDGIEEEKLYLSRASVLGIIDLDVGCQLHSSLNTWIVRSESKLDSLLVKCDRTTCSLASRRMRTWREPTILLYPRDQKCSFRNSSTPSMVEASRRHLSKWLVMWIGVVWSRILAVNEQSGNNVTTKNNDNSEPQIVSIILVSYTSILTLAKIVQNVASVKKSSKAFTRGRRITLRPGTFWQSLKGKFELEFSNKFHCLPNSLSAHSGQLVLYEIGGRKSKNRSKCLVLLTGCEFNYQIRCCSSNYGKYKIGPVRIKWRRWESIEEE